jgi:K+-sensing histidine kinase KdpD
MWCDADLLGRAVAALVANADRHGRSPSGTAVTLSRANGDMRIEVRDQGAGVAAHRVDDLFAPLGDPKRTEREIGGLGLAFCRAAVQAHGGSVGFEANEPRGSRFWIRVPVSPSEGRLP